MTELNLEEEYNKAADSLMNYLANNNPETIPELSKTYELVNHYQEDPNNYLSKELSIKKCIELHKEEKLLKSKPESFANKAREFIDSSINKILRRFN